MILGGFSSALGSLGAQFGAAAAAAVLVVSALELTGSYQPVLALAGSSHERLTLTGSSVPTIAVVGEVE